MYLFVCGSHFVRPHVLSLIHTVPLRAASISPLRVGEKGSPISTFLIVFLFAEYRKMPLSDEITYSPGENWTNPFTAFLSCKKFSLFGNSVLAHVFFVLSKTYSPSVTRGQTVILSPVLSGII